MGIDKTWQIRIGSMETGSRNKISDVEGVRVGHCTLADGKIQTGVTAILPHLGKYLSGQADGSQLRDQWFWKKCGFGPD